jgi:hypothetical protein
MSSRESIRRLGLFWVQTSNHAVVAVGARDRIFTGVCRSVLSLVGNSNAFLKYVRGGPLYMVLDSAVFKFLCQLTEFLHVADQ